MNLTTTVRTWIDRDPDPETRAELEDLLERRELDELAARFSGALEFGTAGLRGPLGAGPTRMNRSVVTQTAAGLAAYLLADHDSPVIVIGYDARHKSADFARDTAEVMAGAGIRAMLLPRALPTPVLAFAIGHLGATAGVMVTASHNPRTDNGYKVYLGDGSQISSPNDALIADEISRVGPIDALPRNASFDVVSDEVVSAYIDAVAGYQQAAPKDLSIAYTPMHGVGGALFLEAAQRFGVAEIACVEIQFDPDPDFTTLPFPNPEEPGAMDLVYALGLQTESDLLIAHDPDADRLAVGVRTATGYEVLTGDQLGCVLAEGLARQGVRGTFASSIVSSRLLGKIANAHGLPWQQTLTGFKWIGKVPGLVFGYEEALGYCVRPDLSRDKDGISAALLTIGLANSLKQQGLALLDMYDDLERLHGVHVTRQVSIRGGQSTDFTTQLEALVARPPRALANVPISKVTDLAAGAYGLAPTTGVRLELAGGHTVTCRPSGTEPKLKCYIEVVRPPEPDLQASRTAANRLAESLVIDVTNLFSSAS